MADLVGAIAQALGYAGPITFDRSQPTGHRHRQFDTTRLQTALDWQPSTPFALGLAATIDWHVAHRAPEE
jgi:dTDP-glucose 4,6-dehydratase